MPFRRPDFLLISQATAAAFTVARLLQFRLARRFPFLCSYLLFIAVASAFLSVVAELSRLYFWTFMIVEPLSWCVAALAVFEMFALVFANYPGLRTAGRWALYAALGASAFISVSIALTFPRGGSPSSRWLFFELGFDRSVHFSLTVVIAILMWFLSRYPLHLDRNTYIASTVFSAMFLAQAAVKLIDSVSPHLFARYADYPEVAFEALCFLGWGIFLQAANAPAPVRAPVNKPREAELLRQLDSLNGILSRPVRH